MADRDHTATKQQLGNDSRDPQLLSLPAEIRVMIYNYTLLFDGDIKICGSASYPIQPGILQVNRQVRNEAIDIYYNKNTFRSYVHDFDASVYINWCCSPPQRLQSQSVWHFGGRWNWGNLTHWLQAFYEGKVKGHEMTRLGGEAIPDDRGSVVIELFSVVRKMRKQNLSWVQVAEHMETMRRMVTSVGKKWEQEATVCIAVSRMVALSAITSRVCSH